MTPGDHARALRRRLSRRAGAYAEVFLMPGKQDVAVGGPGIVLAHLHWFCHAGRSSLKVSPHTGTVDPLAMAAAEGRREVWLEIQKMLTLDSAELERAIDRVVHQEGE